MEGTADSASDEAEISSFASNSNWGAAQSAANSNNNPNSTLLFISVSILLSSGNQKELSVDFFC